MAPTWAVPGLFSLMGVPSGNFRHCKFDNILTRVSLHIFWFSSLDQIQSTPVNSYPDNSDLCLIRMYLRPPFREDQSNIIRLIRISHYSYYFIRSPVIRIRRILL